MRKHISFAIVATIVGLAVGFWVKVSVMDADVAQPKFELSSSLANPYLQVRTLDSVYWRGGNFMRCAEPPAGLRTDRGLLTDRAKT